MNLLTKSYDLVLGLAEKHRNDENVVGNVIRLFESKLLNDQLLSFAKNLGIVFVFKAAGFILSVVVSILIAHSLGPVGTGTIGMVQTTANFLVIPMIMGVNISFSKYLPSSAVDEKKVMMSTALIINLLLVVVFSAAYFTASPLITAKFKLMSNEIWRYSIILTVIINFGLLTEGMMRGNKSFYNIGFFRFISLIFFLGMTAYLIFIRAGIDLHRYFIVVYIYQTIFVILAFFHLGIKSPAFSVKYAAKLYHYGVINTFSWTLTTIVFGVDIYIVNYFCSAHDLGIYSAYIINAKTVFSVLFYELFVVVFLPTIADMDKNQLLKTLDKLSPVLLPIFLLGAGITIALIVFLFGREFPLKLAYILPTALGMAFSGVCQLYVAVISMEGSKGARLWLYAIAFSSPFLLLIQFLAIRTGGTYGAIISYAVINLLLLLIVRFMIYFKFKDQ